MRRLLPWLLKPGNQAKMHLVLTGMWIVLIIPTLLFWRESVLWIALMSIWANISGHAAAWQAARGEQRQEANA